MGNPTIKDIARESGVSTATVSYVINNNRTVSDDLRNRVISSINKLGYSPNAVARSLRQKHTGIVGIIGPSNSDPFYAEMVTGIEDMSYKAGYSVMLCNTHLSLEREINYFHLLKMKRVDGVMLLLDNNRIDWIQSYLNDKIPVVRYGYSLVPGLDIDTVRVDNLAIGKIATNYLIELGHRHIACISPPSCDELGCLRVIGYKETLELNGYVCDSTMIAEGDYSVEGGYHAAKQLLQSGAWFSAIFVSNDATALGAMHAIKQAGYHIPDDISIIGVDNIMMGSYLDPPLTSVSIPVYSAGEKIFNHLLERMTGIQTNGPREVILNCELIIRNSCKKIS